MSGREPPLRVGLAGFGKIARIGHLPALRSLDNVSVSVIAERDPGTAMFARHFVRGATVVPDLEDLLAREDVDAVVICLPPSAHAAAAIAVLESGRAVYVEKPLATTLEDAHRALVTSSGSRCTAMMGFNYRFHPGIVALRNAVHQGRLGDLVSIRSAFTATGRDLPPWKRARASGGGALLDLGIHHADLVHFLTGQRLSQVQASVSTRVSDGDTALVQGRTTGGIGWQGFFCIAAAAADRIEVTGTDGVAQVDRYAGTLTVRGRGVAHDRVGRWREEAATIASALSRLARPPGEPSYRAALTEFVRATRAGEAATPDFRDGVDSLAALIAAERSALTGSVIGVTGLA